MWRGRPEPANRNGSALLDAPEKAAVRQGQDPHALPGRCTQPERPPGIGNQKAGASLPPGPLSSWCSHLPAARTFPGAAPADLRPPARAARPSPRPRSPPDLGPRAACCPDDRAYALRLHLPAGTAASGRGGRPVIIAGHAGSCSSGPGPRTRSITIAAARAGVVVPTGPQRLSRSRRSGARGLRRRPGRRRVHGPASRRPLRSLRAARRSGHRLLPGAVPGWR